MEKYKVLEHTADIMIEAYGKSVVELFANAVVGMCEQVTEKRVIAKSEDVFKNKEDRLLCVDFLVEDLESELRDFLNEVKDLLYAGWYPIEVVDGPSGMLLYCEYLDRDKTVFSDEIKSVTFHEMDITRDKGIWKTKIVFDV